MTSRITRVVASAGLTGALALGGAAPALAAKHHSKSHKRTRHAVKHASDSSTTSSSSATGPSNGETALTGSTLSSASAAALAAVPGGTVDSATTETDSSNSSAAYEVHVTKSDGTHVLVLEDSSFTVLSVTAETGGCSHGGPAPGA